MDDDTIDRIGRLAGYRMSTLLWISAVLLPVFRFRLILWGAASIGAFIVAYGDFGDSVRVGALALVLAILILLLLAYSVFGKK